VAGGALILLHHSVETHHNFGQFRLIITIALCSVCYVSVLGVILL